MKTTTETWSGRAALMLAHCAGMVDLVALPVWVGTLMSGYHQDAQQAGGLATLFLLGAVASSLFFAPRLRRIPARLATCGGFAGAALAFAGVALSSTFAAMAVLHVVAGIAAACALSFTHGTIGRSARPHRLFAMMGMALGVFAIAFLGAAPKIVAAAGAPALFWIFSGVMALASAASALAFPVMETQPGATAATSARLPAPVWYGAVGVSCMGLVQAMMFSFLERAGAERGFSAEAIMGVLIALGIVNLFPAPLAAVLERRLPARNVLLCGPVVQAALALLITQSQTFELYAAGAMFFAAVMIFTHTFAFGLLASLDPSGRALAATPAMVMTGAAIGPILGGTVVKLAGYPSLGIAIVVIAVIAIWCFLHARRPAAAPEAAMEFSK